MLVTANNVFLKTFCGTSRMDDEDNNSTSGHGLVRGGPWKPILTVGRRRPPAPPVNAFAEFKKRMAAMEEIFTKGSPKVDQGNGDKDDEEEERDVPARPLSSVLSDAVVKQCPLWAYNGKDYHELTFKDPWWSAYLRKQQEATTRYEEKKVEPYHFIAPEMDAEEVRRLDQLKMFVEDDGLPLPVGAPQPKKRLGREDLIKLLYGDLDEDPDSDDETSSTSAPSLGSGVTAASLQLNYHRFYDFSTDLDYDTNLAVYHSKDSILECVAENKVTIILGRTGTGKTTQIPLYLLDACARQGEPCNIIVTQPRRLAAVSNAHRVAGLRRDAKNRRWRLGDLVGYHVGMSATISQETRLTFCTTAIFLKIIGSDLNLGRFTHIVLDEVHERDQDTDLCLMLCKKMMAENSPHVKLIIMSATMDVDKIKRYFSDADPALHPKERELSSDHSLHIEEKYLDDVWPEARNDRWPIFDISNPQLYRSIFCRTIDLIASLPDRPNVGNLDLAFSEQQGVGAVLLFVPGMSDIQEFSRALRKRADADKKIWEIMGLHSTLSSERQELVMRYPEAHVRRIIVATNIAESSITIPYITFVIDLALTKRLIVDRELDVPCLALQWASKANMVQRKGRCGRVQAGTYYCIIPRAFRDKLGDHEKPDMLMAPIHHSLLHVKCLNLPKAWKPHDLFALLLDPPSRQSVDVGILQLKEVGALSLHIDGKVSTENGDITPLGRILERLPVSLNIGRLLILSYVFGAVDDGITLAAGLSIRNIFRASASPEEALGEWIDKRVQFAGQSESDCIAVVRAYEMFALQQSMSRITEEEEKWCHEHVLSPQRMREMEMVRNELCWRLEQIGLYDSRTASRASVKGEQREDLIKILVAGSFYPLYFLQKPIDPQFVSTELSYGDPQLSVLFTHLPQPLSMLYEPQLQVILDPTRLGKDIPPKILFKDDKAYVNFSRHTLVDAGAGEVSPRVLLAMLAIRRVEKHDALQEVKSDGPIECFRAAVEAEEEKWKQDRILCSFIITADKPRRTPVIPPACAPRYGQLRLPVKVLKVYSAGRIFISNGANFEKFDKMRNNLQALWNQPPPPLDVIVPGDFALALHPLMKLICRVQVVRDKSSPITGQDEFQVYFVDWGDYQCVGREVIRQLPPAFAAEPAFALEFNFANIRIRDIQSEEIRTYLSEILASLHPSNCLLEVYSLLDSVVHGMLHIRHPVTGSEEVCLNDELARLGYAYPANESAMSKIVHTQVSSAQMDGPRTCSIKPPAIVEHLPKKMAVTGPFSPVVAKFGPVVSQLQGRVVRCASDSVNARVMDGNAENSGLIDRLMVATSIEKSEKSERVTVRNTTLLPRQPGLVPIMLTLFAPCIQLQSNHPEGFTGAIAGLGFGPSKSGKKALSLYRDHDVRIQFDTLLTPVDVDEINDLRHLITTVLNGIKLSQPDMERNLRELEILQKSCRSLLFGIIKRPRKNILEMASSLMEYQWNLKYRPWLSHGPYDDLDMQNTLLQRVYVAPLKDFDKVFQKDKHRNEIWRLRLESTASVTDKSARPNDMLNRVCPLCGTQLVYRQDICHHLNTSQHKNAERHLVIQTIDTWGGVFPA